MIKLLFTLMVLSFSLSFLDFHYYMKNNDKKFYILSILLALWGFVDIIYIMYGS